ncbi:hypothetical protein QCA50_005544 [Cerrena zonata]|uniref:Uncharacterized protein n=1 Tax=Cerrena zonata TaxID=2478898 RepID=A0AAW0GC13_9APHY
MDYCPEGIGNVVFAARDAFTRHDYDTFVRATNILLSRLPSAETSEWQGHGREWLGHWLRDLEQYFRIRNIAMSRYDVNDVTTKWCSGLVAIGSRERDVVSEKLVIALEEGIKLGLVGFNPEEGEALNQLKTTYLSISNRPSTVAGILTLWDCTDVNDDEDIAHVYGSKIETGVMEIRHALRI